MTKHILTILMLAAATACAAAEWLPVEVFSMPAGQELRAYGRVSVALTEWHGPEGARVGVMRFQCANSAAAFAEFATAQPAQLAGAVPSAPYPAYLDRFDRYGWECYGMGGFSNYHDWMTGVAGERTAKDPTADVQFMIEHGFRFEPWLDPVGFDTSDGLARNREHEWMIKMLTDARGDQRTGGQAGMPFSFRVYGAAGGADWTARGWGPTRTVTIPAEWESTYFVRLYMAGGHHDTAGAMVNGRLARRHHHWFGRRCDIDITRFFDFGEGNRLELVHVYGGGKRDPKRPPQWNLEKVELHLYARAAE